MSVISPIRIQDSFEETVLTRLFGELADAGVAYAVLRNYEQLPYRLGARDLDILVAPEDMQGAVKVIVALASDFGFQFANYYSDERLTQFALWARKGASIFDLKIDFFTSSQVYGIELLSAHDMLKDRRWHNGIPVVSDAVLLLDKWLFHLAVGRPLHPKYDVLFSRIARFSQRELLSRLRPLLGDLPTLRQVAEMAAGRASQVPALSARQRLSLLARMFARQGRGGLASMARFLRERLSNKLRPHGTFLSVSGPDGSGKTTVIDLVLAQLRQAYGNDSVEYHHFRPSVLPRIAEMAKASGAVTEVDADYGRPHRARPSGIVGSTARLGYYGLDYLLGYWRKIRPALVGRRIVVFDRYYHDMICDPGRSRIALPEAMLRLVGRLLPLPQFSFFIHVDAAVAHARKQELTESEIDQLNGRYAQLVAAGWMIRVDNSGPPERAAAAIVDTIIERQDRAARKALGGGRR